MGEELWGAGTLNRARRLARCLKSRSKGGDLGMVKTY